MSNVELTPKIRLTGPLGASSGREMRPPFLIILCSINVDNMHWQLLHVIKKDHTVGGGAGAVSLPVPLLRAPLTGADIFLRWDYFTPLFLGTVHATTAEPGWHSKPCFGFKMPGKKSMRWKEHFYYRYNFTESSLGFYFCVNELRSNKMIRSLTFGNEWSYIFKYPSY